MNKATRKQINDLLETIGKIEELRSEAASLLSDLRDSITGLADEEQEKFDNMSEGLQAGPTGEAISAAAEALSNAAAAAELLASDFEDADLSEIESNLTEAMG